jgi:hypothetical protein
VMMKKRRYGHEVGLGRRVVNTKLMVMVVVIQHAGAIKYQASCSADGRTL